MVTGTTQAQQAGVGTYTQEQLANSVQQLKISDKRKRNEMMRLGTSNPSTFALTNQPQLQQAVQPPTDVRQAGNVANYASSTLPSNYKTEDIGNGKYNIYNDGGNLLGLGYKGLKDSIQELAYSNSQGQTLNQDGYYTNPNLPNKSYTSLDAINADLLGLSQQPTKYKGGNLSDWEVLGQLLYPQDASNTSKSLMDAIQMDYTAGSNPMYPKVHKWSSLPGNGNAEKISGLDTLYGSTPMFDPKGNLIGYNTDLSPGQDYYKKSDEYLDKDTPLSVMRQHTGKSHAYQVGLQRIFAPGDWSGVEQLDKNGNVFINASTADKTPGWANSDAYKHVDLEYDDGTGSILGGLGALLSFTPLAPVGAFLSAAGSMANNNPMGAFASVLGPGMGELSKSVSSGLGVSKEVANALVKGAFSTAGTAMQGGNVQQALLSGLGSGLGSYAGGSLTGATKESLGSVISKMFGGAANAGINSLFTKGDVVNGSLYGAMSGGLHGYLNSVSPDHNTENANTAKTLVNLFAKQMRKK